MRSPGQKPPKADEAPPKWILALILIGVCFIAWHLFRPVYLLSSRGEPATARVIEYTPEKRYSGGRRGTPRTVTILHYHMLEYDGYAGKVELTCEHEVGSDVNVLYLPDAPDVVAEGTEGQGFAELLCSQPWLHAGVRGLLKVMLSFTMLLAFIGICNLVGMSKRILSKLRSLGRQS